MDLYYFLILWQVEAHWTSSQVRSADLRSSDCSFNYQTGYCESLLSGKHLSSTRILQEVVVNLTVLCRHNLFPLLSFLQHLTAQLRRTGLNETAKSPMKLVNLSYELCIAREKNMPHAITITIERSIKFFDLSQDCRSTSNNQTKNENQYLQAVSFKQFRSETLNQVTADCF